MKAPFGCSSRCVVSVACASLAVTGVTIPTEATADAGMTSTHAQTTVTIDANFAGRVIALWRSSGHGLQTAPRGLLTREPGNTMVALRTPNHMWKASVQIPRISEYLVNEIAAKIRLGDRSERSRRRQSDEATQHREPFARRLPVSTVCRIIAFTFVVATAGCASTPVVTVHGRVDRDSEVAVVMFRDCTVSGQEDCDGSGLAAGSIFARVWSGKPGLRAVPLSRPVAANAALDDSAAVEYAKSKGYKYVLNGEVVDYYRVAPMTFRTERAGVAVRLLGTSDGKVVAFFSERRNSATNLTTPDALIEKMATHVRDSLVQ